MNKFIKNIKNFNLIKNYFKLNKKLQKEKILVNY